MIEQTYYDNYDDNATDIEIKIAPLTRTDVQDYYSDQSFRDEFPIPHLTGSLLTRQYSTWDEYIKDKERSEIPTHVPISWNPIDADVNSIPSAIMMRELVEEWPMSGSVVFVHYECYIFFKTHNRWFCDKCDQTPGRERRFHCAVCPGIF